MVYLTMTQQSTLAGPWSWSYLIPSLIGVVSRGRCGVRLPPPHPVSCFCLFSWFILIFATNFIAIWNSRISQPFLNFVQYRSPKRLDLIKCHESPWVAIRLAERKSIITWGHPQNFKWPRTFVMTSFFVIVLIEICFHRYFTKKFLIWRKWSIVVQHVGHDLSNRDNLSRSSQYISAESIINLIIS